MTTWWNNNVKDKMNDFESWVGGFSHPTKVYCRKHVVDQKYQSILDCGCGLATEYYGYKNDKYQIQYTGLDSCQYLIDEHRSNGIEMIEAELEKDLPIADNLYECVYCREVIEHLSFYEKCINEMIRVAKKEVLIAWFIKPGDTIEQINYWESEDLYHNVYNYNKLNNFILDNPKVNKIQWHDLDEKFSILHIFLKEKNEIF